MRRTLIGIVVLGAATVHGQTPSPTPAPAFEVASVKPNKSGDPSAFMRIQPGGRVEITNTPLWSLLTQAYQIQRFQLIGAPEWAGTDRFDISAKAPDGVQFGAPVPGGAPLQNRMLQALLIDRFKLKAHTETREMPTYTLVMARPDGRLGPRLALTDRDCQAIAAAARAAGKPPGFPPPGAPQTCGLFGGFGRITGGAQPIVQLARTLSQRLNRIVVDQTRLSGNYDFIVDFMPDNLPPRAPGTPADQPLLVNGQTIDADAPPLLRALEEQLGLKLESTKGPVDVLVIDSVSQPTPD